MLKVFWVFKNLQQFQTFFNGNSAEDVRQLVVRRGWYHFNMQAVAYITVVCIFSSLKMMDVVTFAGLGFFVFTAIIYANTQRNIRFTEVL